MGDYDAMRPQERARLERFATAFETVDPTDYEQFAGTTASEAELARARDAALRGIGSGPRRAAVEAAVRAFTQAAERALAERAFNPLVMYGGASSSPRLEDRTRLVEALEGAVVAVILWDQLRPDERDALLGPWARIADRAMERSG